MQAKLTFQHFCQVRIKDLKGKKRKNSITNHPSMRRHTACLCEQGRKGKCLQEADRGQKWGKQLAGWGDLETVCSVQKAQNA